MIRMLPVFCLIGTRTSVGDKLFIGWFGPRGLATIVFVVHAAHFLGGLLLPRFRPFDA
jgi:NhaP-type Na+/H+ or K+/H+ antiporter